MKVVRVFFLKKNQKTVDKYANILYIVVYKIEKGKVMVFDWIAGILGVIMLVVTLGLLFAVLKVFGFFALFSWIFGE